jgi:type IV pilus assembly protein PilW
MRAKVNKQTTKPASQRGVTLIELMVAMVISLILLIGVGSVYISSKRSYAVQEEYARMQENAHFAFQFLTQDIRQAGYAGCNPVINNMLNLSSADDDLFDFTSAIYGWEYTGSGPGTTVNVGADPLAPAPTGDKDDWDDHHTVPEDLHASLEGKVLAGTDVVVIKSAREVPNLIPSGNTPPNSAQVDFPNATGIKQGTVVMLSDCDKADLFMNGAAATATSLTRASGCGGYTPCNMNPANKDWSHNYRAGEYRVVTTTSRAYFIGVGASGEPALFRISYDQGTGGTPEELIEGVESMQVLYGEDLVNDTVFTPTRYVTFDNVTDINNVISVRVSLLMRTPAEMPARPTDTKTYRLGGVDNATAVTVNPSNDKRLRKVFTTTIVLRNKLVTGRG